MIQKHFTIDEVFNNALIGLTFEFLSSKNYNFILEDLGRLSGKKISLTDNNDINPTWSNAVLLKEYNSKKPRYQLKFDSQDYPSLNNLLPGILEWVNKNGELNEFTKLKVDLMFNNRNLDTMYSIDKMNKIKLILQMNEDELYKRFPDSKTSPFALSVKNIVPFDNLNIKINSIDNINNSFNIPKNDYYAIDFTEQKYGKLSFNYIGGKNYAENTKNVVNTIKYYISETYQILNSDKVTNQMESEVKKINEKLVKYRKSYYDVGYF